MKNSLKIVIGVSIILLCLGISAVSAAENTTPLEKTNNNTISISENDSPKNDSTEYVARNFESYYYMKVDKTANCTFSESDLQYAKKHYMGVTKTFKDAKLIKVKEVKKVSKRVKTYKYSKITKKAKVGKFVNGRLRMDQKKYFKLLRIYESNGYTVTERCSGNNYMLVATKTVKKFNGYKTVKVYKETNNWVTLKGVAYQLVYSPGGMDPEGYYVSISPLTFPYTGKEYYSDGDLTLRDA